MIQFIRRHLGVKLFISYLIIILLVTLVLLTATRFTMPGAFNRHLGQGNGLGATAPMAPGAGSGRGMMEDLFANFQASFNDALLLSLTIATLAAVSVSILLSRGVVSNVQSITNASKKISKGHYSGRVPVESQDELGQMAESFNLMAENLEQVESMRTQLIADVSHELRTPLTYIQGAMEALQDGVLPSSNETFEQVHQEAGRLSRLVDDLQELSRIEAGAINLDMQPSQIENLIQASIKRFSSSANKKNISLQVRQPDNLPAVIMDDARITQVLTNLVSNAIQYSPQGGKVLISVNLERDEMEISISDSGIGITPEHIPHIFTRFYRVDKSRSRQSGGGSGIGLTIAKSLVEAHHGRIWVVSPGVLGGSTFTFTLPLTN
jgi:signal transduction histidine kinase